jgi:hypothetical protein
VAVYEVVGNLHMHTPYSDGEGSHSHIVAAAHRADLDFVIATDHNVLVQGVEGYYGDEQNGYVLLLTGEEVHDQTQLPQINHLLVYADCELAHEGFDPQNLIQAVNRVNGLAFLAHPHDPAVTWMNFEGIPWQATEVTGFTGLELWNYMSSFKGTANGTRWTGPFRLLHSAFRPEDLIIGPEPETLALWDRLLTEGQHVVAIGNSDAHGVNVRYGPLHHVVFPYDFLFNCVNTHVLLPNPLSGEWRTDRAALFRAIRAGNVFVGYDLPGSTRGFRYSAAGAQTTTIMGGTIRLGQGVTLQAHAPDHARMKMIFEGQVIAESQGRENLMVTARNPGAYRVEVWREFRGQERGWIFSNPIYVEDIPFTPRA